MNEVAERKTAPVLDALALLGKSDSATVVLVGSGARDTMHGRSDIDVLIIHEDDHRIRLDRPGYIHLQQQSRTRFLKRLENGDDYPGLGFAFWDTCPRPMWLVGRAGGRRTRLSPLARLAA